MKKNNLKLKYDSKKSWLSFFVFLAALLIPLFDIMAGVLVAPSVVIISEKGRAGRMTIHNPSETPKEISIGFSFGLPESDSLGNVDIRLNDSTVTHPRSALGWIRAFPRKLVIPPNGTQIVRFVAKPPKGLADGEHWCRIMVESQEGVTSVPSASNADKITTRLNMVMRTAVMLKYRSGELIANLEVKDAVANMIDTKVEAFITMINNGNVSYVGMLKGRLLDATGKEITTSKLQVAIYDDLRRRLDFFIPEGGNFKLPYKVELSISNRGRRDIPEEEMIYGNDIMYTVNTIE